MATITTSATPDLNTRRFPRTLDEAFPRGASYGCAVERPEPTGERLAGVVLALTIGIGLAALLAAWWSS